MLFVFQRRNNYGQGKKRIGGRASRAQREDSIRRTVYVSDVDHNVSKTSTKFHHILAFFRIQIDMNFIYLKKTRLPRSSSPHYSVAMDW